MLHCARGGGARLHTLNALLYRLTKLLSFGIEQSQTAARRMGVTPQLDGAWAVVAISYTAY